MGKNKNIVWLASYPKSGNTWLRVLLTNYLSVNGEAADINNLITAGIASNRKIFEEATGLSSSDLGPDEIEALRPGVYRYYADTADETLYIKVHDANRAFDKGAPLFPPEITKAAVYIVRNPLDVAVSFKFHSNCSFDKATRFVCSNKASFCSGNQLLALQLEQKLLSWDNHVRSWTGDKKIKVLTVRYEDLLSDTVKEFTKIVIFLGLPVDNLRINQSVENSKFEKLKEQEEKKGFGERPVHSEAFFRKGLSGGWKDYLDPEQAEMIREKCRDMMEKYGY